MSQYKVNDLVKISGAYFKSKNGTYRVIRVSDRGSLTLQRVNRDGTDSKSRYSTEFWPLSYFCSDEEKNRAAMKHDKDNVKLERVGAWEPVAKEPEFPDDGKVHSIKFFWNGIKVNGGRLIKCSYSLDNNVNGDKSVSICASDYDGDLPADMFVVRNDTDYYTDYFDKDSTCVTPEHPLYKYARYAAEQAEIHYLKQHMSWLRDMTSDPIRGKNYRKEYAEAQARLEKLSTHKNPGHPAEDDIAKVYELNAAAETERLRAEKEQRQLEFEQMQREKLEGRKFIAETAEQYPLKSGEPVVEIGFSELPAFYDLPAEQRRFSLAAADRILAHFDELNAAKKDYGYDKTDFLIHYTNEDGEPDIYEGRYDLGDGEGGLTEHIRRFGEWKIEHNGENALADGDAGREIVKFADYLDTFTAKSKIISIEVTPWAKAYTQKRMEQQKAEIEEIMGMVEMLTDEQLEDIVMGLPRDDKSKDAQAVARFFLQQIMKRNPKRAVEVLKKWKTGGGS